MQTRRLKKIPNDLQLTIQEIDDHLDNWTKAVQQATETHVPK